LSPVRRHISPAREELLGLLRLRSIFVTGIADAYTCYLHS
jgi:hypothetical protein